MKDCYVLHNNVTMNGDHYIEALHGHMVNFYDIHNYTFLCNTLHKHDAMQQGKEGHELVGRQVSEHPLVAWEFSRHEFHQGAAVSSSSVFKKGTLQFLNF